MPWKPKKPCAAAGCGRLTDGRYCDLHKPQADAGRASARQRGYGARWERESAAFLALPGNRFCACGCGQVADMVDHKRAHRGDPSLFWDRANWQPMNRRCNSRKARGGDRGLPKPKVKGCAVDGTPLDPRHPWAAAAQGRGGRKV